MSSLCFAKGEGFTMKKLDSDRRNQRILCHIHSPADGPPLISGIKPKRVLSSVLSCSLPPLIHLLHTRATSDIVFSFQKYNP